jgi:hypothetical protein
MFKKESKIKRNKHKMKIRKMKITMMKIILKRKKIKRGNRLEALLLVKLRAKEPLVK